MKKLIINHTSDTGNRKVKTLEKIKSVTYDYGYEFPIGTITPAVKIQHSQGQYHLIGCQFPEKLTEALQKADKKAEVILPLSVFDWGDFVPIHVKLEEWHRQVPGHLWYKKDCVSIFTEKQCKSLYYGNMAPILNKHIPYLAELWAATMPTPLKPINSSKKLFFHEVLIDFVRRNSRNFRL